jgi:transposase-like protein
MRRSFRMGKISKPLCKWDKDDIKDNFKELKKIVAEPRYICKKCGRVAKKEEFLCKPEEL